MELPLIPWVAVAAVALSCAGFCGVAQAQPQPEPKPEPKPEPAVKPEPARLALRSVVPLLQVASLQASLDFYVEKLGFKLHFRDEEGFAIVGRDECELYLAQKEVPVDLRNRTARKKAGYAAYDVHFMLRADTVDVLYGELRAAGVKMPAEFEKGPVNRPYGIRDFSVLDPDGYDLVFGAPYGEAALHREEKIDVTDTAGKLQVVASNLPDSLFQDVNLKNAVFDDINLAGARFININLRGASFHDVNLSGARFSEINLTGTTFQDCDMSGVTFTNCIVNGMKINGVLVAPAAPAAASGRNTPGIAAPPATAPPATAPPAAPAPGGAKP